MVMVHSPTHPLTHSLTHALTHSITHFPWRPNILPDMVRFSSFENLLSLVEFYQWLEKQFAIWVFAHGLPSEQKRSWFVSGMMVVPEILQMPPDWGIQACKRHFGDSQIKKKQITMPPKTRTPACYLEFATIGKTIPESRALHAALSSKNFPQASARGK